VDQPLLVLLLPRRLERFELERRARELLRAPGVVAVDPSRLSPGRMPSTVAAGLAVGQAKRMRLPGSVAAVAIFHPLQFYLAGALLARHHGAELWYGRPELEPDPGADVEQLHAAAVERATLDAAAAELFDLAPLRMAELGILSGPPSGRAA
jgi:hypothetical protein